MLLTLELYFEYYYNKSVPQALLKFAQRCISSNNSRLTCYFQGFHRHKRENVYNLQWPLMPRSKQQAIPLRNKKLKRREYKPSQWKILTKTTCGECQSYRSEICWNKNIITNYCEAVHSDTRDTTLAILQISSKNDTTIACVWVLSCGPIETHMTQPL